MRNHDEAPQSLPEWVTAEENPLQPRLRGRARWLRERGHIKDAELMEAAAIALDMVHHAAT